MKRILITGANSYIGTSFEKYINANYSNDYKVDTVDLIDGNWRKNDFSVYDAILHVAGIVHKKETKKNAHLYYQVNCDLAIEVAKKARNAGVKQFVYLSTVSVYGLAEGVITKDTVPNPKTHYGRSKLMAEEGLKCLSDSNSFLAIVRPPMVYGENCKGNYTLLEKWIKYIPIFPDYKNKRSMININNLCCFLEKLIRNNSIGLFFPQDDEYMCTTELVKIIAKGKSIKYFQKLRSSS